MMIPLFWPLQWRTLPGQPAGRFERWILWRHAIAPLHDSLFAPRDADLTAVQEALT